MEDATKSGMNDSIFDELVISIESRFNGRLPALDAPHLIALIVSATVRALPCVREAGEHCQEWFASGLALALARRLATADRKAWLN